MIDVGQTLFSTIQEKIDRLRFLADNDTSAFKKILYVIILRDLAEWTKFKGDDQCTYSKLNKKIDEFILRNPEFIIERANSLNLYTNVNTPQTIHTWQRVFDNQELKHANDVYKYQSGSSSQYAYVPDASCEISIVYFVNVTAEGEPDIDRSKLTTCEKMNIFINRNTGEAWYLNPNGNWERLKGDVDELEWDKIIGAPTIYQGIKHTVNSEKTAVEVELLEDGDPKNSDVLVASSDLDLEDVL